MVIRNKKYFILWIEGIGVKSGEKVKRFYRDANNTLCIEYTTKMMEALRVRMDSNDVIHIGKLLKEAGVAQWVLDSPNTFIPTSYAPKGTISNL